MGAFCGFCRWAHTSSNLIAANPCPIRLSITPDHGPHQGPVLAILATLAALRVAPGRSALTRTAAPRGAVWNSARADETAPQPN